MNNNVIPCETNRENLLKISITEIFQCCNVITVSQFTLPFVQKGFVGTLAQLGVPLSPWEEDESVPAGQRGIIDFDYSLIKFNSKSYTVTNFIFFIIRSTELLPGRERNTAIGRRSGLLHCP